MKSFLKFIMWAVIGVVGIMLGNFWFSWAGELITTKNSFAVGGGLIMVGVGLGVVAWVGYNVVRAAGRAIMRWQDDQVAELHRSLNKKDCCENDCGCKH